MTFRVLARERDDGDYEPIAAFSIDLVDELNISITQIDDWLQQINEFIQVENGNERLTITDLANVEDVMSEEYFYSDVVTEYAG